MCCELVLVDVVVASEEVEDETDELCVLEITVVVDCDPRAEVVEELSTMNDIDGLELVLVVDSVITEEEVVLVLDELESDEALVDEVVVDNVRVTVDPRDVLEEVPNEEVCVELEVALAVDPERTEEVLLDDDKLEP